VCISVGTWAGTVNPADYTYQVGNSTQFQTLTTASLTGLGDPSDSFDADLAGFFLTLPALGAGIPGFDDDLNALELGIADLATDEFTPILADLAAMGPGLDSSLGLLGFLGDFGSVSLSPIMTWLDELASTLLGVDDLVASIQSWVINMSATIDGLMADVEQMMMSAAMGGGTVGFSWSHYTE
jgi:hypothetical protein